MQQNTITIVPRSLTDDELLRLSKHYLTLGELPRDWQEELTSRFEEVLDALADAPEA